MLSKDIMTIPEDEILATDVVYTIVGGKVAFDHTARPPRELTNPPPVFSALISAPSAPPR